MRREHWGCGRSRRELQAVAVAGAQEDGDALDVQGVADALGDGLEKRVDFGEVARLFGEFGEDLFGGVCLAEEPLIEALLKTPREHEAKGEEDSDDGEHLDDVDVAMMARPFANKLTERPCHP